MARKQVEAAMKRQEAKKLEVEADSIEKEIVREHDAPSKSTGSTKKNKKPLDRAGALEDRLPGRPNPVVTPPPPPPPPGIK